MAQLVGSTGLVGTPAAVFLLAVEQQLQCLRQDLLKRGLYTACAQQQLGQQVDIADSAGPDDGLDQIPVQRLEAFCQPWRRRLPAEICQGNDFVHQGIEMQGCGKALL